LQNSQAAIKPFPLLSAGGFAGFYQPGCQCIVCGTVGTGLAVGRFRLIHSTDCRDFHSFHGTVCCRLDYYTGINERKALPLYQKACWLFGNILCWSWVRGRMDPLHWSDIWIDSAFGWHEPRAGRLLHDYVCHWLFTAICCVDFFPRIDEMDSPAQPGHYENRRRDYGYHGIDFILWLHAS